MTIWKIALLFVFVVVANWSHGIILEEDGTSISRDMGRPKFKEMRGLEKLLYAPAGAVSARGIVVVRGGLSINAVIASGSRATTRRGDFRLSRLRGPNV